MVVFFVTFISFSLSKNRGGFFCQRLRSSRFTMQATLSIVDASPTSASFCSPSVFVSVTESAIVIRDEATALPVLIHFDDVTRVDAFEQLGQVICHVGGTTARQAAAAAGEPWLARRYTHSNLRPGGRERHSGNASSDEDGSQRRDPNTRAAKSGGEWKRRRRQFVITPFLATDYHDLLELIASRGKSWPPTGDTTTGGAEDDVERLVRSHEDMKFDLAGPRRTQPVPMRPQFTNAVVSSPHALERADGQVRSPTHAPPPPPPAVARVSPLPSYSSGPVVALREQCTMTSRFAIPPPQAVAGHWATDDHQREGGILRPSGSSAYVMPPRRDEGVGTASDPPPVFASPRGGPQGKGETPRSFSPPQRFAPKRQLVEDRSSRRWSDQPALDPPAGLPPPPWISTTATQPSATDRRISPPRLQQIQPNEEPSTSHSAAASLPGPRLDVMPLQPATTPPTPPAWLLQRNPRQVINKAAALHATAGGSPPTASQRAAARRRKASLSPHDASGDEVLGPPLPSSTWIAEVGKWERSSVVAPPPPRADALHEDDWEDVEFDLQGGIAVPAAPPRSAVVMPSQYKLRPTVRRANVTVPFPSPRKSLSSSPLPTSAARRRLHDGCFTFADDPPPPSDPAVIPPTRLPAATHSATASATDPHQGWLAPTASPHRDGELTGGIPAPRRDGGNIPPPPPVSRPPPAPTAKHATPHQAAASLGQPPNSSATTAPPDEQDHTMAHPLHGLFGRMHGETLPAARERTLDGIAGPAHNKKAQPAAIQSPAALPPATPAVATPRAAEPPATGATTAVTDVTWDSIAASTPTTGGSIARPSTATTPAPSQTPQQGRPPPPSGYAYRGRAPASPAAAAVPASPAAAPAEPQPWKRPPPPPSQPSAAGGDGNRPPPPSARPRPIQPVL